MRKPQHSPTTKAHTPNATRRFIEKSVTRRLIENIARIVSVSLLWWGFYGGGIRPLSLAHAGSAGARETLSLAFLIGQNSAGGKVKSLRYAETDVQKMREVLLQNAGFQPESIWSVRGATVARVQQTMRLIQQRVRALRKRWGRSKHLVILLYYSGHARQGKLLLGQGTMAFSVVQQFLRTLDVDVRLAIVDACESGPASDLRGLRRRKDSFPIPRLQIAPTVRGEVLLSATGAHESAHEDPELRGGVFTHYLVSGLRGAADRDQDGKITLEEIYHYTYTRSLARTVLSAYGPQRAHFQQRLSGYGQLILAERFRPQAWLLLRRELVGDFFVWDAKRRRLLAEINKRKGKAATLALSPGRYLLHWRHTQGAYRAPLELVRGQRMQLRSEGKRLAYLRKGDPKGDPKANIAGWGILEEERTPWRLQIAYTAGYSHLVKGMFLHGPLLTSAIPLTGWESIGGALFFGLGYQHHLDPMASGFSFAIHRPYAEVGLQIRLFERADGAFQIGLSARVAALFQTISPSPERPGETLVSWNAGGALHLASEHYISPQTALVWGITAEIGGIDIAGAWKPATAVFGHLGCSFSLW